MNTSENLSEDFVSKLRTDYPQFKFKPGPQDHWSSGPKAITYNPNRGLWQLQYGLLHELSHALLGHNNYTSDFELLKLESEAWELAARLAKKYKVKLSDDHIQNCLDTYRDWLHRRSACPACGVNVLQKDAKNYKCFNCQTQWSVSHSRFVRAYRKTFKQKTTT